MNELWGVMQGRLTDKDGFFPQQFPWDNWEDEFSIAKALGFGCIEWMFNMERYEDNPIWTKRGRKNIKSAVDDTGVAVRSVCANYFMKRSLNGASMDILRRLLDAVEDLGVRHVVLPLFGTSEVVQYGMLPDVFGQVGLILAGRAVRVCFEADIPVERQLAALDNIGNPGLGLCYDVGNATGGGYDCVRDLEKIIGGKYYFELHLKDKDARGRSVMLGRGKVDFAGVLRAVDGVECLRVYESYFGSNAVKDTAENATHIREILGRHKTFWPDMTIVAESGARTVGQE